MKTVRWWLCCLVLPSLPFAAPAQAKRDAIVIFKDGFHIKGVVNEKVSDVVWDRASGRPFPILSGSFFLNDHVREIIFSPSQVIKVVQPPDAPQPVKIIRKEKWFEPRELHSTWVFTGFGKWTEKGERFIQIKAPKGNLEIKQIVAMITPNYVHGISEPYRWNLLYFTDEFGPELSKKIVLQIMSERKEYQAWEPERRYLKLAEFMQQAGWLKEAEKELESIVKEYPSAAKFAENRLAAIKKDRANLFVDGIKKASEVGQHLVVVSALDAYDRDELSKIVSPQQRLMAQDLRAKYDKLKTDMADMRRFLTELPTRAKNRALWSKASAFIVEELNHDTADRLDEFLVSAKQWELERKNNGEISLSPEKVLAIGISGWLQGNQAALPDADAALKMAGAREFLLEYAKADNANNRAGLMSTFKRGNDLSVDVLARLVRMIPPPAATAADKLTTDVQTFTIEAPDSDGGSYLVQLPPDYHHQRACPVLVLLHSGRDKADETLKRFSEEAARNGFILAAPLWTNGGVLSTRYQGTQKEQTLVMDTLRDLRRRFQVDSDRVFLFGWEDGGNMAFDVALGHPDQFAGVAPMNGGLLPFTRKFYWPNAQYLPFYVIGGERDGHSTQMKDLFKDWTRNPFSCMYVEYKGRASEWYSLEVAKMMNWMSRKKRYSPMKEIGAQGVEFKSTRPTDNRFYWLRGDNFTVNTQYDHREEKWPGTFRPATFQVTLTVGNKSEKGAAKIWNQLLIRTHGMKSATLLITPGMMDLKYPLAITLNSQPGRMRVIEPSVETMVDELLQTGDRQRPVIAKVDLRP